MKSIKVVCGIIWKNKKIFIARRKEEKSMGGFWEFPGGKIEPNEDATIALERELKEELGMEIKVGSLIGNNVHQYETFKIDLIGYQCEFISATFQLTDHDKFCFVKPSDLINYQLAPADIYFINRINSTKE